MADIIFGSGISIGTGISITPPPLTIPDAPTIGSATATSATTATVAFTAPINNGGSTITSYTATSSPGSITGTLSQAGSGTITVSGLTPSTSYTFTVTATNAIGTSSPSSASNSITTPALQDSYFMYNTMLLPGNGTNNAQNNTFLDGSTNNFTITRAGNTTQGTFSPYGSNWGNYFNGTSSISIPTVQTTTGSFTAECWFYRSTNPANYHIIFGGPNVASAGSVNTQLSIQLDGRVAFVINAASPVIPDSAAGVVPIGQWSHIAWVRSGASCAIFVNGSRVTTGTSSGTAVEIKLIGAGGNGSGGMYGSGYGAIGYISNARITTTAVYDPAQTTITVPTSPLTAIAGTTVLTCQSNRFIDNSTNAYSLTLLGSPTIQRFSPFEPTAAYSTSTIGGSGYFDGTGDYLTIGASSAFAFGTGDFTVEAWVRTTETTIDGYYRRIYMTDGPTGNASGNFQIALEPTTGYVNLWDGTLDLLGTSNVCNGAWNHIAATRSGTTLRLFVNGVQQASTTYSVSVAPNGGSPRPYIGTFDGSQGDYNGYMTDVRVVKGTAVYTSNFTPPTAPLTAIANTSLLLNYTNGGIIDNAMMNNLETVGNAQISTTQSKFGGSSMSFDGTGDWLASTASTDLYAFGTGDFTIEFWLYLNTTTGTQVVYDCRPPGTNGTQPIIYTASGVIGFQHSTVPRITGATLSTSTWYHIALSRSGTNTKLFVNGTQSGSTYTSDSTAYTCGSGRPIIGTDAAGVGINNLNGYVDDLRVTKGYARYTSNFTAPTSAFPTY